MTGSLLQLVAWGAQDVYLTGNPQTTFFKVLYKRHTNFSIEAIEQPIDGIIKLGSLVSFTIKRDGDLLSRIYIETDWTGEPSVAAWRLGHQIIEYVEVEIGGNVIDKQYGEWMDIWAQLTYSDMEMEKLSRLLNGKLKNLNGGSKTYTPLQFWFCKNEGLALPLIALQYHVVKINIKLNEKYVYADPIIGSQYKYSDNTSPTIANLRLFCDYIFLDTDERRLFAINSHEYLIEQVQYSNKQNIPDTTSSFELNFNHPIKELIFALKRDTSTEIVYPYDYWAIDSINNDYTIDMINTLLLRFDNQDRFKVREGNYFRCVQPFQHHTGGNKQIGYRTPVGLPVVDYLLEPFGGFYIYSFALHPESYQPTGTCNFSRIDDIMLYLKTNSQAKTLQMWAINYNILRIMSGMGGVAYAN
jgi:hypothetical protein